MPVLSKEEGITYLLIFRDQEKRKKCPSRIPFECITGAHKKPKYPKSNTYNALDEDEI